MFLTGICWKTKLYFNTVNQLMKADEDVKRFFSALKLELKTCKNKYQDNSNKKNKFSLRCYL